jgi:hypothetical protein
VGSTRCPLAAKAAGSSTSLAAAVVVVAGGWAPDIKGSDGGRATREVVWGVGDHARSIGSVIDPTNGQRESSYRDTAEHANPILKSDYAERRSVSQSMLGNANGHRRGPVMLDPNDSNIVYVVVSAGGLAAWRRWSCRRSTPTSTPTDSGAGRYARAPASRLRRASDQG